MHRNKRALCGFGAQEEFLQMVNEPIEGGLDAEMLAQMGGYDDEEMGEGGRALSNPACTLELLQSKFKCLSKHN